MSGWRIFITPAAERAVRKLPKEVQDFVFAQFPGIVKENPLVGELLSGPLSWLRSYHFLIKGKPYRIAYSLDYKSRKIHIHYADYRGGFYERLKQALRK